MKNLRNFLKYKILGRFHKNKRQDACLARLYIYFGVWAHFQEFTEETAFLYFGIQFTLWSPEDGLIHRNIYSVVLNKHLVFYYCEICLSFLNFSKFSLLYLKCFTKDPHHSTLTKFLYIFKPLFLIFNIDLRLSKIKVYATLLSNSKIQFFVRSIAKFLQTIFSAILENQKCKGAIPIFVAKAKPIPQVIK